MQMRENRQHPEQLLSKFPVIGYMPPPLCTSHVWLFFCYVQYDLRIDQKQMQGAYVIGLLRHIFDHFHVAVLCMCKGLETLLLICDS